MVKVSLKDFITSGTFGPVTPGMSRTQVLLSLGLPSDVTSSSTPRPTWDYWKYGDFEFYFQPTSNTLGFIFLDNFRDFPTAGVTIELDLWIIHKGLSFEDFVQELTLSSIPYQLKETSANNETLRLSVGEVGVELIFTTKMVQGKPVTTLEALSYSVIKPGHIPVPDENSTDNPLEALVTILLSQPPDYLNSLFSIQVPATQILLKLAPSGGYKMAEVVPEELLEQLHQKIRQCSCEEVVWSILVPALSQPLPVHIAHDLLNREVAVDALGHSSQVDEVQWRMAAFYDEALLTLGIELYTNPARNIQELTQLLSQFGTNQWLLETLARKKASNQGKERAFLELIEQQPNAQKLRGIYNTYELARQATDPTLPFKAFSKLYESGVPEVWVALAVNPATPTEILRKLTTVSGIKSARIIRHSAHANLSKKGKLKA